jgi:hypothetical protein
MQWLAPLNPFRQDRHMWTAPMASTFLALRTIWSAAVICPAYWCGAYVPLALMKSDDWDPYQAYELYAHDDLQVVPSLR